MLTNIEIYERNLPPYLAHDLETWKKGVEKKTYVRSVVWKGNLI